MKNIHPYHHFIPIAATRLLVGTIPPARFCSPNHKELYDSDVDFYYGSKDNAFWSLIGEVFGEDFERSNTLEAIEQRKSFLTKHKIGITDIISACSRENLSASDEDLKDLILKDLNQLLIDHPKIDTLIYTSEFVKKQVNKHFNGYHLVDKENKNKQSIKINGKQYDVRILYSPSPSGLRNLGIEGRIKRLNQYKEFLMTN
jgi:hypoxanthine-DNA glycosylase